MVLDFCGIFRILAKSGIFFGVFHGLYLMPNRISRPTVSRPAPRIYNLEPRERIGYCDPITRIPYRFGWSEFPLRIYRIHNDKSTADIRGLVRKYILDAIAPYRTPSNPERLKWTRRGIASAAAALKKKIAADIEHSNLPRQPRIEIARPINPLSLPYKPPQTLTEVQPRDAHHQNDYFVINEALLRYYRDTSKKIAVVRRKGPRSRTNRPHPLPEELAGPLRIEIESFIRRYPRKNTGPYTETFFTNSIKEVRAAVDQINQKLLDELI